MAYLDSPIRTFKCDTCGKVEKINILEDERGAYPAVQCTCEGMMHPYQDPNQEPINLADIESGRGLPTIPN